MRDCREPTSVQHHTSALSAYSLYILSEWTFRPYGVSYLYQKITPIAYFFFFFSPWIMFRAASPLRVVIPFSSFSIRHVIILLLGWDERRKRAWELKNVSYLACFSRGLKVIRNTICTCAIWSTNTHSPDCVKLAFLPLFDSNKFSISHKHVV